MTKNEFEDSFYKAYDPWHGDLTDTRSLSDVIWPIVEQYAEAYKVAAIEKANLYISPAAEAEIDRLQKALDAIAKLPYIHYKTDSEEVASLKAENNRLLAKIREWEAAIEPTRNIDDEFLRLKAQLTPDNWTIGEKMTFFGFFVHGWYGRMNEAAYQKEVVPSPPQSVEDWTMGGKWGIPEDIKPAEYPCKTCLRTPSQVDGYCKICNTEIH